MIYRSPNCFALDRHLTLPDIARIISDDSLTLGIDWLKVGFPARAKKSSEDTWRHISVDPLERSRWCTSDEYLNEANVKVRYFSSTNWGSIEFNPSKVADLRGGLVNWEQTHILIPKALELTRPYFWAPKFPEDCIISEIHLALNFAPVLDMQRLLTSASEYQPIRGVKPFIVPDAITREIESVTHSGTEAPRLSFYNKSKQLKDKDQMARIEVRLRNRELRKYGLNSPTATEEMRRAAFRARLGDLCRPMARNQRASNRPDPPVKYRLPHPHPGGGL